MLKQQADLRLMHNPCLGQLCTCEIIQGEFVQIIHDGHGHWLTVSTVGQSHGFFNVYDSLKSSINLQAKNQIAAIIHTARNEILL
jgi:hypothetical protein